MHQPIVYGLVCFLGLLVGSFLTVVIYRLPQKLLGNHAMNLAFPASHCPCCKTRLAWYENIPLLSFIFQAGRCRHCKTLIHWRYPLVEVFTTLLSLAVVFYSANVTNLVFSLLITWCLLPLMFIDLEHMLLPNGLNYMLLLIGVCGNLFFSVYASGASALLGALIGYGIFYILALAYRKFRGIEGLGGGDIKLLAALGACFGWQRLPALIFFSAFLALLLIGSLMILNRFKSNQRFCFGPFLCVVAYAFLIFPEAYRLFLI